MHDLSLLAFVDDLFRVIPLDDAEIDALNFFNNDTAQLNRSIRPNRYAQNESKAEITI